MNVLAGAIIWTGLATAVVVIGWGLFRLAADDIRADLWGDDDRDWSWSVDEWNDFQAACREWEQHQ